MFADSKIALQPSTASSFPVTISIVSHGHGAMVERLALALLNYPEVGQIIVTRNIPEVLTLPESTRITSIVNARPQGFASNHNAAFNRCRLPYFCPLNPDIQLVNNPFPVLLTTIQRENATLVAPLVKNPSGMVEDSMRSFPTVQSLLLKALGVSKGRSRLPNGSSPFSPDWVAGMFMLFRSNDFRRLGGFDPRFYLYYEDVDICMRAWKTGMKIIACPNVSVVHDAQRASHRNLRHFRWHLASMTRYFMKHWGQLPHPSEHQCPH